MTAGQRVGVTAATLTALDLGVSNDDVSLFFVRPDRHLPMTIHADSPLKYFTEPTRSTLYANVQRPNKTVFGGILRSAVGGFVAARSNNGRDPKRPFGAGRSGYLAVRRRPSRASVWLGSSCSVRSYSACASAVCPCISNVWPAR